MRSSKRTLVVGLASKFYAMQYKFQEKMYTKRCISVFILILSVAMLSVSPLIVDAASYSYTYSKNVFTYQVNIPKKYSRNNAATGWTGTTTTSNGSSSGYDGSYKKAIYREYKDVNGHYVQTYYNNGIGTRKIVKSDYFHTVASTAVRREHITELHKGSNSSSSIVEKITITVNKPS